MPKSTADLLRSRQTQIVAAWAQKCREMIPAAKQLDEQALLNGINIVLKHLAECLEQAAIVPEITKVGVAHGVERAALADYKVNHVLHEYANLRRVVFKILENDGGQLSIADRELILAALFETFQAAAQAFDETRVGIEKTGRLEREEAVRHLESERESRERFVATLSHDLRTPMNVAKTSANVILRTGDKEEVHQLAARIIQSVDRMEQMIRDLLDASVIRAGKKLMLTLGEFELQLLLETTAQQQNAIHGERIVVIPSPPVVGWWSESYVKRAIENLCDNALKYGCEDMLVYMNQWRTGDRVQIAVHNKGNPIPPDKQERIFDQFESESAAKGKSGWGLGLTLVRGVAEAHGGSVSVQSSPSEGTTFTMDLPVDSRPFVTI